MPSLAALILNDEALMKEVNEEEEEDFYNEKVLEEYVEDDEISGNEEGFMIGYLQ